MNISLRDIAQLVQGVVIGNDALTISALSPITHIAKGALVFADGKDNIELAEQSEAAAILVNESMASSIKPLIKVPHPLKAFIALLNHFNPIKAPALGIHPTAVIADNVKLGANVSIGPYVVIESGSVIGDDCVLKSHVSVGQNVLIGNQVTLHSQVAVYDHCVLGARVVIHASSVIGSDGFGYTFVDGKHLKMPHIGNVVIEDDVEIGANTVVDKASMGSTRIGAGTKIDNLVQVAHSVSLGKHNILCAFTGIAGSTTSGDHVIFAANVGVSDHVRIDDDVILGPRTGVPSKKHLLKGNIYLGNPARPKDKALETDLSVTYIPGMRKKIKDLSEKMSALTELVTKEKVD